LPPDAIAAAAEAWSGHAAAANVSRGPAWNDISGWSLAGLPRKDISAIIANGIPLTVEVAYEPEGRHVAAMTGDGTHIPANGRRARASFFDNDSRTLFVAAGLTHCILRAEDVLGRTSTAKEGAAIIHAPMPGRVIAVLVEPNQSVVSGQPLVILDAMKM